MALSTRDRQTLGRTLQRLHNEVRLLQVVGVPKIVINDRIEFEGALPEQSFIQAILRATDNQSVPTPNHKPYFSEPARSGSSRTFGPIAAQAVPGTV